MIETNVNYFKKTLISLAISLALPAFAEESAEETVDESVVDDAPVEKLVVTGTRIQDRSINESTAPVDILTGEYFMDQGATDVSDLVRNVVPSYNVNTQPISDASTVVRPANLRGLAPDHTLVLVNGKRRHRAAVIHWLGNGVANGAQGVDISAIPASALKEVQVLRDGAAAQYGSDAIAGVMNFILKDDAEGGSFDIKHGQYFAGDGGITTLAGNLGLPFTEAGFVNLSFEYGTSDDTDRSVQRTDAMELIEAGNTFVGDPAQVWGSPKVENDFKSFLNLGLELDEDKSFYSHGNLASKRVDGGFYFRNPETRGGVFANGGNPLIADLIDAVDGVLDGSAGCTTHEAALTDPNCFSFQEMFPGGFTPRFGADYRDVAWLSGVKGYMENGLSWDLSASFGRNEVDFFIYNTVNASLGPESPTAFDPGAYIQTDQSFNADFSYPLTDNMNLAFGAEKRKETFEVRVGDQTSFEIGPFAAQGFSAASNGFPGFGNLAGGTFSRENISLYSDIEWDITERLLVGAALRWEDFDDFGTTTNGKLATNLRITDSFGLRASISTGFKAPTPGQSNAFNVSTEFNAETGELVNNGTIPATNPVAVSQGGEALKPEESLSFTAGTFFDVGPVNVTIDFFKIEVDNRLNLSEEVELSDEQVQTLLDNGITSAANLRNFRFFVNDLDTETQGIDIVASTRLDWMGGTSNFSLSFNHTSTEVTSFGSTVGETRIKQLEEGLPENRVILSAIHNWDQWQFLARSSYYSGWYDNDDNYSYSGENIIDLETQYKINDKSTFIVGIQNALDTYPEENPNSGASGNQYSAYTPFGFNGAFWYTRYQYKF